MVKRPLVITALTLITSLLAVPAQAQTDGLKGAANLSGSIFKLMNQVGTPAPAPATGKTTPAATGSTGSTGLTGTPAGKTTPATTPTNTAKTTPAAKPEVLLFKTDPALRKKNIENFLKIIEQANPEAAPVFQEAFEKMDVLAEVQTEMKNQYGLNLNNLADVWAVFWAYAWLHSHSDDGDPTKVQMQGLRNQFQGFLLNIPEVATYTNARKQEIADSFMLLSVMNSVLLSAYKEHNPANLQEFAAGIASTSKDMGFDLSLLEMTDQGFKVVADQKEQK